MSSFSASSAATFAVAFEEWSNPLVLALTSRKHVFFPSAHTSADRKRRPSTPFEDDPFHALPLGATFGDDAIAVHITVREDAPVRETAAAVRAAVARDWPGVAVNVTVEDVVAHD